jgi:hypothetical protein
LYFGQEEHLTNRKLSKLGATIATGVAATDVDIPSDQALYLQEYGGLGKVGNTTLRLTLLPYGVVFPPYDVISKHKMEKIVPTQLVNIKKIHVMHSYCSTHRRSTKTRMGQLLGSDFPSGKVLKFH